MPRSMPRVPQPAPVRLGASADAVRDVASSCSARPRRRTTVRSSSRPTGVPSARSRDRPDARARRRRRRSSPHADAAGSSIPFFGWFFRPLVRGRAATARSPTPSPRSAAELDGAPEPAPPPARRRPADRRRSPTSRRRCSPPRRPRPRSTTFAERAVRPARRPDQRLVRRVRRALSVALAITRVGALLALFATALADRRGRRRSILIGVVGSAVACARLRRRADARRLHRRAGAPARRSSSRRSPSPASR